MRSGDSAISFLRAARLCCGAAFVVAAAPAWAGFAEGVAAYDRGDFAEAIAEWQPLADTGDKRSLYNLATMYRLGRGVA
ncbi:MAG: hypothetical protein CMM50_05015, partial [Rhodospirillaceae bacterium]|nr:hypothetical protein [Rhodospirillaceae bacterium]